jgi:hypothetical protein
LRLERTATSSGTADSWSAGLSYLIGARSVKLVFRKVEEIRLALWLEKAMQNRFGSKRRAKEEILARYVG